jgi:hypothetical protein
MSKVSLVLGLFVLSSDYGVLVCFSFLQQVLFTSILFFNLSPLLEWRDQLTGSAIVLYKSLRHRRTTS